MSHLWADHFNVHLGGLKGVLLALDYQERVIRPHAMGRFADLLAATAAAPAMLDYLDNAVSDANPDAARINENYGRELLELHTVGAGNHTEADVRGAALIMSGWTYRRGALPPWSFQFDPARHAPEPSVTVLGRRFDGPGRQRGLDLLNHLARHRQTALNVARRICRRFISDEPAAALVRSAADVYQANDTAIVPVLAHVLASPQFAASDGDKVRRPFELMAAMLRATGTDLALGPDIFVVGGALRLLRVLYDLDHEPWGWEPPDGYPDDRHHWLSTYSLLLRWGFAGQFADGAFTVARPDLSKLRPNDGRPLRAVVDHLTGRFGYGPMVTARTDELLRRLGLDPAATTTLNDAAFADLVAVLLSHPRFQVR